MSGLIAARPAHLPRWTRHAELLVYVVPVGGIPPDLYAAYVRLLRAHCELPVASLSRPGAYAPELSPFRSFSWTGDGALRFRFVSTTERIENVDGEDAHACNRPMGVLGLCHCPATPKLRAAYDQFAQSVRHFPGTLVHKCFAFEPQFDAATVDECGGIADLVLFPAHHALDDGESTVSVHLKVVLDTLAVTILLSLEGAVRNAIRQQHQPQSLQQPVAGLGDAGFLLDTNVEPAQSQVQHSSSLSLISMQTSTSFPGSPSTAGGTTGIVSAYSSSSLAGTPVTSDARSRKRQLARQRKLFGDYSVLVGCIPDALEHYMAAIDLLRDEERRSGGASGDVLWLAAALEGYCFCLYREAKDKFVVEIVDKTSEAVALYARAGTTDLECALIENVGWYYVAVASRLLQPSAAPANERVSESIWVKRLLWDALDRGLALFPELQTQRQVEFLVQASRMLELLGHQRRMAFFLHEATSLLISRNVNHPVTGASPFSPMSSTTPQRQKDMQAALLLERIAQARLGITDDKNVGGNRDWAVTNMRRRHNYKKRAVIVDNAIPDDSWLIVRFHVLRQLLALAKLLGDAFLVGKYSLSLLEMLTWCDTITSSPSKRSSADTMLQQAPLAIDQLQRPVTACRTVSSSPDRAGLYSKTSIYFTPPPSLETKTKRYFSLAASPSSTMSSAAASLSSTIANTPRILATPRQQISAAVSAISTKASPAFVAFSHNSHHSQNVNASTPASNYRGSIAPNSPAGPSDQFGGGLLTSSSKDILSDRSASESETSSVDLLHSNGSLDNAPKQRSLFDLSTVRPVWNLRSREDVVKIEKKLLRVLETECGSLRPLDQTKLPTFIRVESVRELYNTNDPLLRRDRAIQQFGGNADAVKDAGSKSDFFYSPFEKKQASKSAGVAGDSTWNDLHEKMFPLHETIELQVVLSNPLGVLVEIQQLSAWVSYVQDGVNGNNSSLEDTGSSEAECYPCSVVLAPYEKSKSVALSLRPLCMGEFCVRGCFVRAVNVRTSFVLATPISLRVVDELPLAALSLVEFGSMTDSTKAATKTRYSTNWRVAMYSSETKHCELRIRNVAQRAITNYRIAVSIRKRGIVRKLLVVTNNLDTKSGGRDGEVPAQTTEKAVETDRVIIRCSVGRHHSLSIQPGDTISIPFDVLLKPSASDIGEGAAGEEEELEWSVIYSDSDDEPARTPVDAFVREAKMTLELVALPSLAISSVCLIPSCQEHITSTVGDTVINRTMDHAYCLVVVQLLNPTETVFKLRFGRRNRAPISVLQTEETYSEIDIGRKSAKRVAIEVPRLESCDELYANLSLAAKLNELLELEWQTYFGTKGRLLLRDNLWTSTAIDDVRRELFMPSLSFNIRVREIASAIESTIPVELTMGEGGNRRHFDNTDVANFRFIDAPHLQASRREQVHVRLMDLVAFVVSTCWNGSVNGDGAAEIGVQVTRDGEEECGDHTVLDDHVLAVGALKTQVEWRNSSKTQHEVQFLFLSEGVFVVTAYGEVTACSAGSSVNGSPCQVWCHRPLYVYVSA